MNKNQVLETLNQLPNEFSTEELIDKLLFIEKIEKGQKDVDEAKTLSFQQAREHYNAKWSK